MHCESQSLQTDATETDTMRRSVELNNGADGVWLERAVEDEEARKMQVAFRVRSLELRDLSQQ
jgi:hypothetical protein